MFPLNAIMLAILYTACTSTSVKAGLAPTLTPTHPKQWDTITIKLEGPPTSETATPNPFTDYRLDVTFQHIPSGQAYSIPGFYAADGNAANTGAASGNVWMVRFTTGRIGIWYYTVSFRTGAAIAAATNASAVGSATGPDGTDGLFTVDRTDAVLPDLRARGRLRYVRKRYLRFADGTYFHKLGTNSPESLLSYVDFDGVGTKMRFENHSRDWNEGDTTWGLSKRGKGLIGAINYLAGRGVNSLFAILMTVKGDSNGQVHPWVAKNERSRYDTSKLDQWQLVFEHASMKGLCFNLAFLETENEALFEYDEGVSTTTGFATTRKIYYREMIARFGHNVGLTVTLGEENGWSEDEHNGGGFPWGVGNSNEQRRMFTTYLRNIDAYNSPRLVHTFPLMKEEIYAPMLGDDSGVQVEGASLQMGRKAKTYRQTIEWIERSARAGKPWVVTTDEIGSDGDGNPGGVPVASMGPLDWKFRAWFCWGSALAGGAGIEVYAAPVDQRLEDFRQFDAAWAEFSRVHLLFHKHDIPFWNMKPLSTAFRTRRAQPANGLVRTFAERGVVYVVYQTAGTETWLDLSRFPGRFSVRWFDVQGDGPSELLPGMMELVHGGREVTLGRPPWRWDSDWVAVVRRINEL